MSFERLWNLIPCDSHLLIHLFHRTLAVDEKNVQRGRRHANDLCREPRKGMFRSAVTRCTMVSSSHLEDPLTMALAILFPLRRSIEESPTPCNLRSLARLHPHHPHLMEIHEIPWEQKMSVLPPRYILLDQWIVVPPSRKNCENL